MGQAPVKDSVIDHIHDREIATSKNVRLRTNGHRYLSHNILEEDVLIYAYLTNDQDFKVKFILQTHANSLVTIKSHVLYEESLICAHPDGSIKLDGHSERTGGAYWSMLQHDDGTVSFRSVYGKYLSCQHRVVSAAVDGCGQTEKYRLE